MLILTYKNSIGEVVMHGAGSAAPFRITAIEGLGLVSKEYEVATYSGCNGQETLGARALARSITIAVEAVHEDVSKILRNAIDVFCEPGVLYISDNDIKRRIKCNQIQIPDTSRILKGRISSFAIQLVCDNPYFEDEKDTITPLYQQTKLLSSPFELPTSFGGFVIGGSINISGVVPVEPIITIHFPTALGEAETITLNNATTGKTITLEYAPQEKDVVMIDIKNRKITSSINGNIINFLSLDTFLGDFILEPGKNVIKVSVGDISSGFTIECRHNNLHNEAVIA